MSFRDHKSIKAAELPHKVQYMLSAFRESFMKKGDNIVIRWYYADSVAVHVEHVGCASIVRFLEHFPDIYIEMDAIAPHYFQFKMWMNETYHEDAARQRETAKLPVTIPENSERVYYFTKRGVIEEFKRYKAEYLDVKGSRDL